MSLWSRSAISVSILAWPLGAWILLRHGIPFECLFHRLFRLHCPGCGTGRSLIALLHLQPLQAVRQNILAIPALVFLGWQHLDRVAEAAAGRPVMPRWRVGPDGYIRTMALVLGFWILRNLPLEPFQRLAPIP